MKYMVSECFHEVGNGTFFTGKIENVTCQNSFSWVYDCGSKRPKTIKDIIHNIPVGMANGRCIDMLVLSHFDDDHVNGLEDLLQKFHVKRLVLPFTEWCQSVREIAILGKKGITPSVALFQLNPFSWLEALQLTDRVGEIVLVQGEGGPEKSGNSTFTPQEGPLSPNIINDLNSRPDLPGRINERQTFPEEEGEGSDKSGHLPHNEDAATSTFLFYGLPGISAHAKVAKISHRQPLYSQDGSFEFVFYNAEKSFKQLKLVYENNGVFFAKKSNQPMSVVKNDIEKTIQSIGLDKPLSSLPANWRTTLKTCYEKHFGPSGEARNNISLCMYAAPCQNDTNSVIPPAAWIEYCDRPATLFTGDINLTPDVIDDMQVHLGYYRWSSIGAVQVPHHGSYLCWYDHNTARFLPALFVQCATRTTLHPHPNVTQDLKKYNAYVLYADRKNAVKFRYSYKQ